MARSRCDGRASGVDVEYGESEILLEDIKSAIDDLKTVGREAATTERKAKESADLEGKDIREASLTGLARKGERASDEKSADAEFRHPASDGVEAARTASLNRPFCSYWKLTWVVRKRSQN
jgi:hypothetical protein